MTRMRVRWHRHTLDAAGRPRGGKARRAAGRATVRLSRSPPGVMLEFHEKSSGSARLPSVSRRVLLPTAARSIQVSVRSRARSVPCQLSPMLRSWLRQSPKS